MPDLPMPMTGGEEGLDFSVVLKWLSWEEIPPEFISSILAFFIIILLAVIIKIKSLKHDPMKKPKGFMNVVEMLIEFCDKQALEYMGPAFKNYGAFILTSGAYIFIGFIIGMIGIPNLIQQHHLFVQLPNPFTNLAMPLSIALVAFGLQHFIAMKYQRWRYLERFIEPVFIFLPINLVTVWSNVLSLTLRLFGNAFAGFCVLTLIYWGFGMSIENPPYTGLVFTPFIAPIAHLYFDVFDGGLQCLIFVMLTMINVSSEYISKEELEQIKKNEKLHKQMKKEKREAKRQARLESKRQKELASSQA